MNIQAQLYRWMHRLWSEDHGALTFEWVTLTSLLTIGVVGGIASTRDAVIDELGDVSQAMMALDQSYTVAPPLNVFVHIPGVSGASDSQFIDSANFDDSARVTEPMTQGPMVDAEKRADAQTPQVLYPQS